MKKIKIVLAISSIVFSTCIVFVLLHYNTKSYTSNVLIGFPKVNINTFKSIYEFCTKQQKNQSDSSDICRGHPPYATVKRVATDEDSMLILTVSGTSYEDVKDKQNTSVQYVHDLYSRIVIHKVLKFSSKPVVFAQSVIVRQKLGSPIWIIASVFIFTTLVSTLIYFMTCCIRDWRLK